MSDEEIDALVDEWGESTVEAAFWLSDHIKEEGLDGIGYMERGRNKLRSTGRFTTKQKMESQMDEKY